MANIKWSLKGILEETPKVAAKIGNALVAAGTTGAAYSFVSDNKTMAAICFGCGLGGKFIAECFHFAPEDDNKTAPDATDSKN